MLPSLPSIAEFHPQVVHFSIALLIVGVMFRAASLAGRPRFVSPAAVVLLAIGIGATLASVKSGIDANSPVARIPGLRSLVYEHEDAAFLVRRIFLARNFDPSLQTFLVSAINVSLIILLLIAVIGMIGVNITGFAALLAGAGLAIGAALNGSLGNLAGGVMMLIFKPFKVGDMIEAQGAIGVVKEMGIFNTIILSAENKTIILPNGPLSTGVINTLTTTQIGQLQATQLSGLTATQLDYLSTTNIEQMSSTQANALTATQVQSLSDEQVASYLKVT